MNISTELVHLIFNISEQMASLPIGEERENTLWEGGSRSVTDGMERDVLLRKGILEEDASGLGHLVRGYGDSP